MIKKLIFASSIAVAMMSCSSKGDFTCECKPESSTSTQTGGTASPLRYDDRQSYVMTDVDKDFARAQCLSKTQTYTSSNNGVVSGTSTRTTTCTLTAK